MEKAAEGAAWPGDEPPMPNIRADFPAFGPKAVPPPSSAKTQGIFGPNSPKMPCVLTLFAG